MSADAPKTPLDFALEQSPLADVKQKVLEAMHALVTTCMTQAMIEATGKPAETVAAEAMAYARQLREIEKHLGMGFSALPTQKRQTQYTTPANLPRNP